MTGQLRGFVSCVCVWLHTNHRDRQGSIRPSSLRRNRPTGLAPCISCGFAPLSLLAVVAGLVLEPALAAQMPARVASVLAPLTASVTLALALAALGAARSGTALALVVTLAVTPVAARTALAVLAVRGRAGAGLG